MENDIALNLVTVPEGLEELFKQAKTAITPDFLQNIERGNCLHLTLDGDYKIQTMVF